MRSTTVTSMGRTTRELTEEQMEARRLAGADAFDEVWEGVLHVAPEPTNLHQRLLGALFAWLRASWVPLGDRECLLPVNVARPGLADWRRDYRCPDLSLSTPASTHTDRGSRMEGCPEVAVEIRSPGDESYAKIGTYLDWGAREVWIIDQDSGAVEIYRRGDVEQIERCEYAAGGWVESALGVRMRGHDGGLEIELVDDISTRTRLP